MEGRYCLMFLTALCLSVEPGTASKEGTQADRLCCAASRSAEPPKSCGSCGPGQCCKDKQCSQCAPLLQCPEGMELYCRGTIEYRYFCKGCPDGTYSENNNSCCNPWTDCEKMGQWTVQQGNETHNAMCGPKPSAILVEPGVFYRNISDDWVKEDPGRKLIRVETVPICKETDATWFTQTKFQCGISTNNLIYWIPLGGFTTFLIILIAASILMLAVMILCLITHIIIHRAKLRVVEEPKSVHPLNLPEPQLDLEDTFSCQFPEEEHGDKILGGNFSLTSVVH